MLDRLLNYPTFSFNYLNLKLTLNNKQWNWAGLFESRLTLTQG